MEVLLSGSLTFFSLIVVKVDKSCGNVERISFILEYKKSVDLNFRLVETGRFWKVGS